MQSPSPSVRQIAARASLALAAALAGACSSGGGGLGSFEIATSRYTFTSPGILAADGRWALVNAPEASALGGTDLNEDGDQTDAVTIALDLGSGNEFVSGVAATAGYVFNNQVFLVVDESLDNDQNGNSIDEIVLLSWTPGPEAPDFVAVLDPDEVPVASAGRLWFVVPTAPTLPDETSLRFITASSPTTIVTVFAEAGTTGSVRPSLLGEEVGMLFLTLDETVNGNQNGDGDATDSSVLALVEAGATTPRLVSVQRAIVPTGRPVRARLITTGQWNVAFLVDEAQQGQNLNGSVPFPLVCSSGPDTDQTDSVLHVLRWEAGDLATATNPPLNSQLPGAANAQANRILLSSDHVALLSQEGAYGSGQGCDLNADGDFTDLVLRWAPLSDPDSPESASTLLRQVDFNVPGGALGAIELGDRFVIASPRTVVVDGAPVNASFLAWAEPGISATYQDSFFDPDDANQQDPLVIAPDFLSDLASVGRNPCTLLEQSVGLNLNAGCTAVLKDNDETDSLPAWLRYDAQDDALIIAGLGWALQALNGGVVIRSGTAFFRVSENADNFDWNDDGDESDFVLFRSPVTACAPTNMGTLNNLPGTPSIYGGSAVGGVFFASETAQNSDLNGDGVISGLAARFFPF
jgi:hypothetical protein